MRPSFAGGKGAPGDEKGAKRPRLDHPPPPPPPSAPIGKGGGKVIGKGYAEESPRKGKGKGLEAAGSGRDQLHSARNSGSGTDGARGVPVVGSAHLGLTPGPRRPPAPSQAGSPETKPAGPPSWLRAPPAPATAPAQAVKSQATPAIGSSARPPAQPPVPVRPPPRAVLVPSNPPLPPPGQSKHPAPAPAPGPRPGAPAVPPPPPAPPPPRPPSRTVPPPVQAQTLPRPPAAVAGPRPVPPPAPGAQPFPVQLQGTMPGPGLPVHLPGHLPMQGLPGQMLIPVLPAAPAVLMPSRPVLLAPATASIVPVSSRTHYNKHLSLQFISADKETQARMLQDPAIAKAILQTLNESGTPVPVSSAAGLSASSAGLIVLARNGVRRLATKSLLLQGKAQDLEMAQQAASAADGILDITHRVPFEEVAKKVAGGTVISLVPSTPSEQNMFNEYIKYFKDKMRAGVVSLSQSMSFFLLPPTEDVPAMKESLYALGSHIPRSGLLAVIAPGVALAPAAAPAKGSTSKRKAPAENPAEPEAKPSPAEPGPKPSPAEPEPRLKARKAGAPEGGGEGGGLSTSEIMDLFSNPELIQLLSRGV